MLTVENSVSTWAMDERKAKVAPLLQSSVLKYEIYSGIDCFNVVSRVETSLFFSRSLSNHLKDFANHLVKNVNTPKNAKRLAIRT